MRSGNASQTYKIRSVQHESFTKFDRLVARHIWNAQNSQDLGSGNKKTEQRNAEEDFEHRIQSFRTSRGVPCVRISTKSSLSPFYPRHIKFQK